jgi:hypothetical protein
MAGQDRVADLFITEVETVEGYANMNFAKRHRLDQVVPFGLEGLVEMGADWEQTKSGHDAKRRTAPDYEKRCSIQ